MRKYAAVPADRLVLLPPGISEQQAAAAMPAGDDGALSGVTTPIR